MWEDPSCPLSQAFMDDMQRIESVADAAARVNVPWLFVHGSADDVVPIQDSRDLFAMAKEPKRLIEIAGADHIFSEGRASEMASCVVAWMREMRL